jgi:ATP-dependent Clp protease ATP-binding subunit ClpA
VADFCNAFIVMTSNLGAQSFQRGAPGFRKTAREDLTAHFDAAVRQFLRPEIYNRLDALIPFHTLTPEVVRAITARQLELICQRDGIRLRPLAIDMDPDLERLIVAPLARWRVAHPEIRDAEIYLDMSPAGEATIRIAT